MPDIGATLREARMRQRLDIAQIEAETKIRAKYLRALENEEWDLLPGPTYVKSFLRSYADALGLDGKLLVQEYKLRHEARSDADLMPISPRSARDRGRQRPGGRGPGPGVAVAVVIVGLIVALYVIGRSGGSGGNNAGGPLTTATVKRHPKAAPHATRPKTAHHAPRLAHLTLVPTGPVYVCLMAGPRVLVPGVILQAGQSRGPFHSRHFRLVLGNAQIQLRLDGHTLTVPPSATAIGYSITPAGRHSLPASERPTCGA